MADATVDSHPTPRCVRGVLARGMTHETSVLASRWPASRTALGQSITTSACAGSRAGTRAGIIFIHGIHGHASLPGFEALLQPLADPTKYVFESFAYWDDVGNWSSTGQC